MADQNSSTTLWDTIKWWEWRRPLYNAVLLVVGVCSILLLEWVGEKLIPPGEDIVEPMALLFGIPLYAIGANVCYTLGWLTEIRRPRTIEGRRRIVKAGFYFSIGLTALPGALITFAWIFLSIVKHLP